MEKLLREKLISVFPTMDHREVERVINGLLLLGLETEDDLKYLKEQDLITLLPTIKSRRFLSVFQPVELLQASCSIFFKFALSRTLKFKYGYIFRLGPIVYCELGKVSIRFF